jgi:hypothetical protein
MKAMVAKRFSVLLLAAALAGMIPTVLRAQIVLWPYQNFDGNICGLTSSPAVTLAYDPTQDDTGDGGGSCHISTDYSQSGVFHVFANNVCCCYCYALVLLQLSNYNALEFDVKWDNSSTVPLSYFNTNFGGGSQGIGIGIGPPDFFDFSSICYSNVIIPDAATNGWVHISAPINHAGTNTSFIGLVFQKSFPAYGVAGTAAFWLDNLQLVGPTFIFPVSPSSCKGGKFTLTFPAIQGATYTLFKSADLVNWTTLVTGYPPGGAASNASLSFTDTNANAGQAYYRIRSP